MRRSHLHLLSVSALVLAGVSVSCQTAEHSGNGYRLEHRSRPSSGFEGRRHWQELYYGSTRVGSVGQYSISPTGRFAVFEDNGSLRLFDRRTSKTTDVTDGTFALPKSFEWHEDAGTLRINYYDGNHDPSTIRLPASR